jgi:hypothetical protein
MRRWLRLTTALAMLLVPAALAVPSAAAGCTSSAGAVQPRPGGWSTVAVPDFPQHNNLAATSLETLWTSPVDPAVMLATNFYTVLRTADGGCTWKPVYALSTQPSAPTAGGVPWDTDGRVNQIESAQVGQNVYLLIYTVDAPRLLIVRSNNGGQTWTDTAGAGLPLLSQPTLFAAPGNADTLYLTGGAPYWGYSHYILASTDGGASWQQRSGPVEDTVQNSKPLTVAIDPKDSLNLWLYGGLVGLRHSVDGGRTWTTVPSYTFECAATQQCRRDAQSVAIVPGKGGKPSELWVCTDVNLRPDTKTYFVRRSTDGGKTFKDVATRDACRQLLVSSNGTVVLATYQSDITTPPTEANVLRFDAKKGFVAFSPQQYKPHRPLLQVQLTTGSTPTLSAIGSSTVTTIERWRGSL